MAWGTNAPQGADDLLSKAQRGGSLCVMPFRRFGAEECAALCAGLPSTGVLELLASAERLGYMSSVKGIGRGRKSFKGSTLHGQSTYMRSVNNPPVATMTRFNHY